MSNQPDAVLSPDNVPSPNAVSSPNNVPSPDAVSSPDAAPSPDNVPSPDNAPSPDAGSVPTPPPLPAEKAAAWDALERECGQCTACALCRERTHVVFGVGWREAEVLFVGEGPGQHEDEQGVPFVGAAGKLLDDMLEITGLDRSKIYIANVVKCRPPRNRDPLNTEQESCLPYLRRQTRLLRPKILVCLGRIAAKAIIRPDYRITGEHGQWVERGGMMMTAIYHPSALLRDPSKRPETFVDLMGIRERIRAVCQRTELSLP